MNVLNFSLIFREAEEAIAAGKDPASVIAPKPVPKVEQPAAPTAPAAPPKSVVATSAKAAPINPVSRLAKDVPEKLPYQFEFILNHPTEVSAMDVDIIKLTAQYTAINGRDFLAAIAQREQKNPQFDFLKPTHMLFSYFTSLVDSYAKIVHPSVELQQRVQSRTDKNKVYEYAVHRWGWTKSEEEKKRRAEYEADSEKLAFQQIDWNDFVLAEVIDFPEDELFEIPGLSDLGLNNNNNNNNNVVPSSSAASSIPLSQMPPPPPPPPTKSAMGVPPPPPPVASTKPTPMDQSNDDDDDDDEEIKVVSNYQQRIGQQNTSQPLMMIDPVSGKPIPLNQLEEHMRIQLLDPKWKEEQKRFLDKQKETGYAEGASIADSLKLFARKRGDIFGQSSNDALTIAQLEELEKKKHEEASKVQWDGFFATIGTTQKLKELEASAPSIPEPHQLIPSSIGPNAGHAYPPPPPPLSAAPGMFPPPPPPMGMVAPPVPPPAFPPGYPFPPAPLAPVGIPPIPGSFLPVPPPGIPPAVIGLPQNNNNNNSDESKAKKPRLESTCKSSISSSSIIIFMTNYFFFLFLFVSLALIPAEEFAAIYTGPCNVEIQLPNDSSNSQFNLNGQTVTLHLTNVSVTIKDVKELLSINHLNQMSTGKIQLKHAVHGFLKDANSLASLNLGNGTILEMSVKSRGGKR
jgi:splicing factor 3A subunit 1